MLTDPFEILPAEDATAIQKGRRDETFQVKP